jgi:DNA-binding response OmpR family regulator
MKVLLVEDYSPVREALTEGIREAGFAVDAAADGEVGLWLATSGEYDVIVLDIMLPKLDGIELLKRLRAKGCKSAVLMLTARDSTDDRVRGLDGGADDYLVKPFAFAEVMARIRALVRRCYDTKDPIIRVADLELDTAARLVRRGGRSIPLSPREYSLLEMLALRRGKVVTRTQIWEHLYEYNSAAESNVVDVLIGHLRRKLDDPALPRLIQTRRGHGYVLSDEPIEVPT